MRRTPPTEVIARRSHCLTPPRQHDKTALPLVQVAPSAGGLGRRGIGRAVTNRDQPDVASIRRAPARLVVRIGIHLSKWMMSVQPWPFSSRPRHPQASPGVETYSANSASLRRSPAGRELVDTRRIHKSRPPAPIGGDREQVAVEQERLRVWLPSRNRDSSRHPRGTRWRRTGTPSSHEALPIDTPSRSRSSRTIRRKAEVTVGLRAAGRPREAAAGSTARSRRVTRNRGGLTGLGANLVLTRRATGGQAGRIGSLLAQSAGWYS